jgi:hypothetical protein
MKEKRKRRKGINNEKDLEQKTNSRVIFDETIRTTCTTN